MIGSIVSAIVGRLIAGLVSFLEGRQARADQIELGQARQKLEDFAHAEELQEQADLASHRVSVDLDARRRLRAVTTRPHVSSLHVKPGPSDSDDGS